MGNRPTGQTITDSRGRVSAADVRRRASRVAGTLTEIGIRAGDVVAVCTANRTEVIECYLAAFSLGALLLPLPTSLPSVELQRLLNASSARVVFLDAATARDVDGASTGLERARVLVSFDGRDGYSRVLAHAPAALGDVAGGFLFPTSGTTGPARLVWRTQPNLDPQRAAQRLASLGLVFGLTDRGGHLVTGSLMQPAPLLFACAMFHAGHSLVLMDRWDVGRFIDAVETERATSTFMVPAMLQALAAIPAADLPRLATLTTIVHGTAPCPKEVKQALLDRVGDILFEYYATVEAPGTTIGPDEWRARPGSVGRPLEGIRIEIHGDAGQLPSGAVGRVVLCTDARLGPAVRHETGDLGWVDDAGYLFLRGRAAETTLVAGRIVHFGDVEAALTAHPQVADARVWAVSHRRLGSRLQAEVVLDVRDQDRADVLRDIRAHLRRSLSPPQRPGGLKVVDRVDRNPAGKLSRRVSERS